MQLILNSQKLQSCPYCFILLYTINLCSLGGQRVNRYRQIQADTIRSKATLNSEFRTPNSEFYDVLSTVQNQSFFLLLFNCFLVDGCYNYFSFQYLLLRHFLFSQTSSSIIIKLYEANASIIFCSNSLLVISFSSSLQIRIYLWMMLIFTYIS